MQFDKKILYLSHEILIFWGLKEINMSNFTLNNLNLFFCGEKHFLNLNLLTIAIIPVLDFIVIIFLWETCAWSLMIYMMHVWIGQCNELLKITKIGLETQILNQGISFLNISKFFFLKAKFKTKRVLLLII